MALKSRQTAVDIPDDQRPLLGASYQCLTEFYREEFRRHHQCLERQREYYSEIAIAQAEEALTRILERLEQLCQREDACEVVGQLLRQFDLVTKLSLLTEPDKLH
jgi:hypothetical protein